MDPGKLITIEGIDGAGKTTLASSLVERLRSRGHDVQLLREPGGVQAAERIRELVKDPELRIGDRTEALLYAAARAELVEEMILPSLERGSWLLLDRFIDSSLAYQGAGRRLGIAEVADINRFGTGGLVPDRTLLLELDLALARSRFQGRRGAIDRLERESDDFFWRTAAAYTELAEREPARFRVLDASLGPPRLLDAAMSALEDLL